MATTPFTTLAVTYPGGSLRKARDAPAGLRAYWLGRPGNLIQLPSPKVGREAPITVGESTHTSLGGVSTVYRRPTVKRQFPLDWDRLTGRDWQIVYGFYRRLFGVGPWAFLPPEDVNRLDESVSLCSAAAAWSTGGSGTITALGQGTSPILPSGVLRWSGAPDGDVLLARPALAGSPSLPAVTGSAGAVPYVPGEPVTLSAWLWAAAGSQIRLRLSGRDAASAVTSELDALLTLTTSPQRFTLSAAAAALPAGTLYIVPKLVSVGAAVDYFVAAPQLEYAASATDWALGAGVPRVTCLSLAAPQLDARLRRTTRMVLAE